TASPHRAGPHDAGPPAFFGRHPQTKKGGTMHPKLARNCALTLAAALLAAGATARADSLTIGFENPPYVTGSIDGQDGWGGQTPPGIAINGAIDQAVSTISPRTGTQDFRISSVFTSGSFGDQTFSPSLTNSAGEPGAIDGGFA